MRGKRERALGEREAKKCVKTRYEMTELKKRKMSRGKVVICRI